ncbi:MAG: peptidoglycan binding domain-containing protein, partial [Thermomicrobiales bacterium]
MPLSGHEFIRRVRQTAPRIGLVIVGGLLLLALGLLAFRVAYGDRIYPAVVVGDVQVGGQTPAEAHASIQARADAINQGTFTFSYNGKTWTPTLAEIGGTVDVGAALAEAEDIGRTGNATDRLATTGSLLRSDKTIPLKTSLDPAKLNAWFDKVDAEIGHPAVDADLVVSGGSVTITHEQVGTIVDRTAARQQILAALQTLKPISVAMPVMPQQPQVTANDLQANYDMLSAAVKAPITANFSGTSLSIDPTTLTQYLKVDTKVVNGTPVVSMDMDRTALATALGNQFSGTVNSSPVNATVAWSDGVGLVATTPSQNGYTLEPDKFADAVVQSFLGSNKTFDLPVAVTRPDVDSTN